MARKARVEFEGAVYHVLDRGDRREAIFKDDEDRRCFLSTLGETCTRTGWQVHAFVLMGNHYHLLIGTPQANLVAGMRWFQLTYTVRFNRRHGLSGHLFQGRYKAVVVDAGQRGYFAAVSDYIHLNPVRAGIVSLEQRLFDYAWSSYRWYAAAAGRPAWFEPASVLGELGLEDTAEGRRHYAEGMRGRAVAELAGAGAGCATRAELRRGWCLGGENFRERMLRLLAATAEKLPRGRAAVDATVRRSHGEEEARHILRAGSELFGLDTEALRTLKKGETRKAAIAALIRERTAVPNAWIARELHLGHFSRVSHCVRRAAMQPQFKDQLARYLRNRARF